MIKIPRRIKIGLKAKRLARKRGLETYGVHEDFGRTTRYYSPFFKILKEFGVKLKGASILHVASSFGLFTRLLQRRGAKAVAFDINEDAVKIAKKIGNKNVVRGTIDSPKGNSMVSG